MEPSPPISTVFHFWREAASHAWRKAWMIFGVVTTITPFGVALIASSSLQLAEHPVFEWIIRKQLYLSVVIAGLVILLYLIVAPFKLYRAQADILSKTEAKLAAVMADVPELRLNILAYYNTDVAPATRSTPEGALMLVILKITNSGAKTMVGSYRMHIESTTLDEWAPPASFSPEFRPDAGRYTPVLKPENQLVETRTSLEKGEWTEGFVSFFLTKIQLDAIYQPETRITVTCQDFRGEIFTGSIITEGWKGMPDRPPYYPGSGVSWCPRAD